MTNVLTQHIARILLPATSVTAVALLVKGYGSSGDGFSAGVVAGTGVVAQYLAFGELEVEARYPALRYSWAATLAGVWLALLVAFAPVILGDPIMTQFPRAGTEALHLGALEFHTAILFDLGVFLIVFGFIVTVMRMIGQVFVRSRR